MGEQNDALDTRPSSVGKHRITSVRCDHMDEMNERRTDKQTHTDTYIQTDIPTDRQTDRQTDRYTDKEI